MTFETRGTTCHAEPTIDLIGNYSVAVAADILGQTAQATRNQIKDGHMPAVASGRSWKVPKVVVRLRAAGVVEDDLREAKRRLDGGEPAAAVLAHFMKHGRRQAAPVVTRAQANGLKNARKAKRAKAKAKKVPQ